MMAQIMLFSNGSGGNSTIKMSGLSRYSISLYKELEKKSWIKDGFKINVIEPETPPLLFLVDFFASFLGKDIRTFYSAIPFFFPRKSKEADIIHCTTQMLALPLLYSKTAGKKYVVTVHDLIPVATKTYGSKIEKLLYFFLLKALKRADYIFADSWQTKQDVIKYVSYPENKIQVLYLGIDQELFYEKKKHFGAKLRNALEMKTFQMKREQNTVLYVGSEHKRKNVECIIKALALVKQEIPDIQFVKVGQAQDNNNRQKLKTLVKECGVGRNIIWKEHVEDLTEEYNKATVFVFPSLYEGFGFPVLEAMACGCPVITTKRTSIPELAGDAALYFDPMNEQDLAKKIITLIKNKKMQDSLRKKGLAQAKKFTWDKCAEETIRAYEKVY